MVVSTAAFHARVRGLVPGLGGFKETKNVSSPSMCESQYCSVLGLRPLGLEFRILFSLYVHKGGLRPDSFHFIFSMGNSTVVL